MAAFTKFNIYTLDCSNGVHNLSSHVLKVALTNSAPVATNTVFANITEIGTGTGYSAGGTTATFVSNTQSPAGTQKLILSNVVFTATGAMGPFRYAVLYNSTPASPLKPLIAYFDYGSTVPALANTETFTVAFDQSAGVFTTT